MEILDYFDQQFTASVELKTLKPTNIVVLIEDLLKLANERLSDEINWILECIRKDPLKFDFSTVSKAISKTLRRTYLDSGDKQALVDYVLTLTNESVFNKLVIEKAKEIL